MRYFDVALNQGANPRFIPHACLGTVTGNALQVGFREQQVTHHQGLCRLPSRLGERPCRMILRFAVDVGVVDVPRTDADTV
ncbi:MAG: hypothetical protein AMXMBFR8_03710 [Nevskiales bacterium]